MAEDVIDVDARLAELAGHAPVDGWVSRSGTRPATLEEVRAAMRAFYLNPKTLMDLAHKQANPLLSVVDRPGALEDQAAGLVPLPVKPAHVREAPPLPFSCYRVMVGPSA